MIDLPGGSVLYEPGDTGFNDTLIALNTTLAGNILPWRAGRSFSSVVFFFDIVSGVSTNFDLLFRAFDIDGQSVLSPIVTINNSIDADAAIIFTDGNVSQASSGTNVASVPGWVLGSLYAQLHIFNFDVVNSANVTLRIVLGP